MAKLLSPHLLFLAIAIGYQALRRQFTSWFVSAAPLTFLLLLGQQTGDRAILPLFPAWLICISLNVAYAIASTSWLLHCLSLAACFLTIVIVTLYQFDVVANMLRKRLRGILARAHFIDDVVALFDLPALEIDTDVDGMMVVRGISISLSSLTIHVHGVEVGIKMSDDLEIALHVDTLSIALFRGVTIGDVYGSLKGGEYEMLTRELAQNTHDAEGDALMRANSFPVDEDGVVTGRYKTNKLRQTMTRGQAPRSVSFAKGLDSVKPVAGGSEVATERYQHTLDYIDETSSIQQCRRSAERRTQRGEEGAQQLKETGINGLRATVCSQLHREPTIPHPPSKSVRVTTLQNLAPPYIRRFQHRLPMLLRLLLNTLSFFHPVSIASFTFAASGKWMQQTLEDKVFKDYPEESSELRKLHKRLSSWLSDANFALELEGITGVAKVPFLTAYPIDCDLKIANIVAHRLVPQEDELKRVVTVGGADARIRIPTFLLPHHEHMLPPQPSPTRRDTPPPLPPRNGDPPETNGTPRDALPPPKDETNMNISVHASLPARFDQELLNFIAALVKATKIIEMEKDLDSDPETPTAESVQSPNNSRSNSIDSRSHSKDFSSHLKGLNHNLKGFGTDIKGFSSDLKASMKDGMKRTAVDAVVNDKWIAKLVGKVTRKMETVQGDVGYSGDVPLLLGPYRERAEPFSKLLP